MRFFIVCTVVCAFFSLTAQTMVLQHASFYEPLDKNFVKCTLCPNFCVLENGETGICKARKNYNGKLYSLVYNKPVAIHLDPIEKKPLYHFYPGVKVLSIATAGCNLCCNFCQNWEISQTDPQKIETQFYTPEDIIHLCWQYQCQMIAFTYTEPTIFYEYMLDIAKLAKKNDLKTVLVTCGYINTKPLNELLSYIDASNIDLKGFSDSFYQTYTTGSLDPILQTIQTVYKAGVHLEITNLVIPDANDDNETINELCLWIKNHCSKEIPLHFSKFFPKYKLINRSSTSLETLQKAYSIAKKNDLNYVYIGNVPNDHEDTFCPYCKKKLIDRKGYKIISNLIIKGECPFCYNKIYGNF